MAEPTTAKAASLTKLFIPGFQFQHQLSVDILGVSDGKTTYAVQQEDGEHGFMGTGELLALPFFMTP